MNVKELATKIYVSMFGNIAMDATPEVLTVIEALLTEFQEEVQERQMNVDLDYKNQCVAKEREACAKVAEDKQRTEALLFGPANCCSQSARTIAGRIKARLSKGTK